MPRQHESRSFEEEDDTEINLTPMLDVVFIMLIFFIVTATFIKETGINVTRPFAMTAEVPSKGAIFVAINENNEIWIDRVKVDPRGVQAVIERLAKESPEGGVVIQADASAKNETLITVMDAAKEAKVVNVTVAAVQP
jgi:biopolymer transport protein ExbD